MDRRIKSGGDDWKWVVPPHRPGQAPAGELSKSRSRSAARSGTQTLRRCAGHPSQLDPGRSLSSGARSETRGAG